MATKGPTEIELSILAGYRHPAKSLQSLRKDILIISQLVAALKGYREKTKESPMHLKRAINLVITLGNVFEKGTIEYAMFALMPKDLWPEAATLMYAMKISESKKFLSKPFLGEVTMARAER